MSDKGTKVFISYKHSETRDRRNQFAAEILRAGYRYVGETDESEDYSKASKNATRRHIKSMIVQSEVTIIILSPRMSQSRWINFEIGFSLRNFNYINKSGIRLYHQRSGVIGVLLKGENGYDWALNPTGEKENGTLYNESQFCEMVKRNRRNRIKWAHCERSKERYCEDTDSYISIITEEDFLKNINKYIDLAYHKSLQDDEYEIRANS